MYYILLYFQKAFDKMLHKVLRKVPSYGFSEGFTHWINFYLSGRPFSVLHGGYFSKSYGMSSGVPQGSFLGSLTFIFIVADDLNCKVEVYADELKICERISFKQWWWKEILLGGQELFVWGGSGVVGEGGLFNRIYNNLSRQIKFCFLNH